jgi:hypothetical protein
VSEGKLTTTIQFKSGINRNVTEYSATGYYVSCDKVRFRDGKAEKIGGWVRELVSRDDDSSNSNFVGVARDNLSWSGLDSKQYYAVGTHRRLEIKVDGEIYDITPIVASVSVSNAITTSVGSHQILISVAGHAHNPGDEVILTNSTSVGNIKFTGDQYEIKTTPTLNTFTVSSALAATVTTVSQGNGLHVDYLLQPGNVDNTLNSGWGGGTWGTPGVSVSAGWNEPRSGTGVIPLRLWSLDNYGQNLVANPRGGSIYMWSASAGPLTRASKLTNAPDVCNFVQVAQPVPHIVAYGTEDVTGTYNPLLVRWCDGEDPTEWVPAYNNTAGDYPLAQGAEIIGAEQTKREAIICTKSGQVYSQRYTGVPFVFGFDPIGQAAELVSPQAIIDVNGIVVWMGTGSFYIYDGSVKKKYSAISKSVFDQDFDTSINLEQKEKTFCGINTEFSEVIWFYPSGSNTENSRYVIWNYLEDIFYDGNLSRTVWEDRGIFERPYAVNPDGTLYIHEQGKNDDATPMKSFVESAPFALAEGDDILFIDRMIPDFRLPDGKVLNTTIKTKKFINEDFIEKGPYSSTNQTDQIHFRARGRYAAIRYSTSVTGGDYEIGSPTFAVKPDGKR